MEYSELENIQIEIDVMKNIDHPNIVKLYDVYEDESYICMVMELMEGGELFDKILECDHFPEYAAREAIKSIIDALRYCHGMNIIHRDLKPENLLIKNNSNDDFSSLKISDFGLARFIKTDEYAQTTCGTPGYVAPEIINLKPYSKECDYWSIGVILYVLLSGTPPFFEDHDDDLFEKIKKCEWEFDGEEWSNVSKEAKNFISKLLIVDTKKRLNCDQMMEHPWMTLDLTNKGTKGKKTNLLNFVKGRKGNKK